MTKTLRYETELTSGEAAHKLSELSLGLLRGRVGLRSDEGELVCHPGAVVRLRIEVEESSAKGRLQIEVAWPLRLEVESARLHDSSAPS